MMCHLDISKHVHKSSCTMTQQEQCMHSVARCGSWGRGVVRLPPFVAAGRCRHSGWGPTERQVGRCAAGPGRSAVAVRAYVRADSRFLVTGVRRIQHGDRFGPVGAAEGGRRVAGDVVIRGGGTIGCGDHAGRV